MLVFAYAHSTRSATLARTQETIREQREALTYLCETVHVIDVLFVQLKRADTSLLRSGELSAAEAAALNQRRGQFDVAHAELSDTRACSRVE